MTDYTELHCHSYFSLLDGASSPEALVETAAQLGMRYLALTDHDSLAGAVRFWIAARRAGLHPVFGAELTLDDGSHLTALAETQTGYANLCRLLTAARVGQAQASEDGWLGKVAPALAVEQLAQHADGLIVLSGCRQGFVASVMARDEEKEAVRRTHQLLEIFGRDHFFMELQRHCLPDDTARNARLLHLAQQLDIATVATNNVHYAQPDDSRLRDALIAVSHNQSLTEARRANHLPRNSRAYLAGSQEMARRFADLPDAVARSVEIAARCQVRLDFSHQRLPHFPVLDGMTEFAYLYELCHQNLPHRYPDLTPTVLKQLAHELDVIQRAGLAGYFLIVWDLVREAQARGIRGQGRGSAANSLVAYLLGITKIDPLQHNLLFERFLSEDRFTTPDIDIDFAADRREEIIQYVYARYGHAHTAMVCNVVTYQAKSALRDMGKALDFPLPVLERLGKTLDTHSATAAADVLDGQVEEDAPAHHPLRLLADLMRRIDGCPRHLSIHSGGMLITGPRLDEVAPLEPATMPGRYICQWDKDSCEDAGLVKIDLLGLGMLGLLSSACDEVGRLTGQTPDLDALPLDDPVVYALQQRGDTIGAFQVESRAQQQMLPRLKPQRFEDMIVEVAIVRPGPIQGGAVHPYLRRRAGLEPVTYLHPCLKPVLAETMGVVLFQEQAIRVAVAAAGFTPGEADFLRRALSRKRNDAEMAGMRQRFLEGAHRQSIDAEIAAAIFNQLAGFAGFGFCKSHAASFALVAYHSLWLRHYHPAAFYCALLNHQPMGFYRPEVIVGDAKRHGVALLPPDVNRSRWKCTVERIDDQRLALRTGLSAVHGLGESAWNRIEAAREARPFRSLGNFCRRTRLAKPVVAALIRAGALDEFGDRRRLLWQLGEVQVGEGELEMPVAATETELPAPSGLEQTLWEYELMGLSPDGQVMRHFRAQLRQAGILSTWQVKHTCRDRERVQVAGMVVVRQRPQTAKGILFISLEDESGLLDLVVKPNVYPQVRPVLQETPMIVAQGIVQKADGVASVLVHRIFRLV